MLFNKHNLTSSSIRSGNQLGVILKQR